MLIQCNYTQKIIIFTNFYYDASPIHELNNAIVSGLHLHVKKLSKCLLAKNETLLFTRVIVSPLFTGNQKLHHMNMPMTGMPHAGQNQVMGVGQSQPFGGNMPHQQGYGSYGVAQQVGPRMPNPHQPSMNMPQNISQNNVWNANQNQDPSFMQQNALRQQMMSPQQQTIPSSGMMGMRMGQQNIPNVGGVGGMQQTQYLSHHDFALPTSSTNPSQPMNNYPTISSTSNQQSMFMQRIGSPNHMSHVPISAPNNPLVQNQPQHAFQQMSHQMRPPGFGGAPPQQMQIQQQQQGFTNNYMPQQHQQVNLNSNIQTSSYQRFQFPHGQQGSVSQMGDIHPQNAQFNSKTSPNQNPPFRPGYSAVPQQRATTPSPRPTPPPSLTPETHNTSPSSQGSVRLPGPQADQMISPPQRSTNTTPISSPFHPSVKTEPVPQSVPNSFASPIHPSQQNNNQTNNSISGGQTQELSPSKIVVKTENQESPMGPSPKAENPAMMGRVGMVKSENQDGMIGQVHVKAENRDGMIGPNCSVSSNVGVTPSPMPNVEMEIQSLQQQLNQLQGMPQTQQSQENMLGLQERIRSLRAQQELQRQQQQQMPQQQQMQQQQQMPQQMQQQIPPQQQLQPQQQPQFQIHPQPPPPMQHMQQQQPGQQMIQMSMSGPMPQQPMGSRPQLIQIRQPTQYAGQPQKLLLVTQTPGGPIQRLIQPVSSTQQMVPGVQHGPMAVGSPQKILLQVGCYIIHFPSVLSPSLNSVGAYTVKLRLLNLQRTITSKLHFKFFVAFQF